MSLRAIVGLSFLGNNRFPLAERVVMGLCSLRRHIGSVCRSMFVTTAAVFRSLRALQTNYNIFKQEL